MKDYNDFIREGKIAFQGTIDELTENKDPFLVNFFSDEVLTSS